MCRKRPGGEDLLELGIEIGGAMAAAHDHAIVDCKQKPTRTVS
jgi:hypothetical protein